LAHFIGSIVYIEQGLSTVTEPSPVLVIDGQQRLTTVTLILAALADALGDTEPVDGFSRRKLRHRYLIDQEELGERRFKLLLSQTDKESLTAIVDGGEQPKEPSMRVTENFRLFQSWIARTHRIAVFLGTRSLRVTSRLGTSTRIGCAVASALDTWRITPQRAGACGRVHHRAYPASE
jgi:hypothetical protein